MSARTRNRGRTPANVPPIVFKERFSDVGNARWFDRLHGECARYVPERKAWFVNVGAHWREDSNGELERMAKSAITTMLADLGRLQGKRFFCQFDPVPVLELFGG
jgi:hypothetical protein